MKLNICFIKSKTGICSRSLDMACFRCLYGNFLNRNLHTKHFAFGFGHRVYQIRGRHGRLRTTEVRHASSDWIFMEMRVRGSSFGLFPMGRVKSTRIVEGDGVDTVIIYNHLQKTQTPGENNAQHFKTKQLLQKH